MLEVPRWLLALVASSFATFHAVLGILAWHGYDNYFLLALSIAVYLITVAAAVMLKRGLEMGSLVGAVVGIGAVSTSVIANLGISPGQTGTYASWYVGGMGVLLGIVAVRGQSLIAWVSAALVTSIVVQAAGVVGVLKAGIVGMVVLIAAGQATAGSLRRADRDIHDLQQAAIANEAETASAIAAGTERKERLQQVLTKALPALSYISSTKGKFSETERKKLIALEASLRDDIRGRRLASDIVQAATQAARERGVQVMLMDEGGLDKLSKRELNAVLQKVADAIDQVKAGKVVVRSPRGEKFLVTVTATRPGTSSPDLWLRF